MSLGWQAEPTLIGGLLTLALVYGLLVGPLRQRLAPGAPFPTRQAALFYAALVVFYLAEGSPLHDLSEIYLFTAHMTQHLLLSYVVALLLIVGTPVWILRPLLLNRLVRPPAKALTHPVAATIVFSLFFSVWHFPAIYEGALQSDIVHHSEHLVFIGTAILMWWPLLSPLPELPRLSDASQLLYLFALTLGQFLVTAILVLASGPFYPTYAAAPRVFSLSAIADQQLGGVVMKVVSAIVYSILFVLAFFRWYRSEIGLETRPPAKCKGSVNQVAGTKKRHGHTQKR
jgi:putative membrane protein